MNQWQLLFLQSKANSNLYDDETPALQNWAWPQGTWFQKRLNQLRRKQRQTMEIERLPIADNVAHATFESPNVTTARLFESNTQQGAWL